MTILDIKKHFNILLLAMTTALLTACGGGGSNSGGAPAAPPPPPFPLFSTGDYSGTLTLTLDGQGITFNNEPQSFGLEVTGDIPGTQQVRIAFRQFSGTSAILREGTFSIPSGPFPLRIVNRGGSLISQCTGELQFDGTFANDAVSGTVTVTQDFTCDRAGFGPITGSGTFDASLGSAKRLANDGSVLTLVADR